MIDVKYLRPWLLLPSFLSTLTFFEPYSNNSKADSFDKHPVSISIIMSEANSIAGTVGTGVAGFVVLLVSSLITFYIARSVNSSKTEVSEEESLLQSIKEGIENLHDTEKAQLDVLLSLEKIALEVKNESGDVLALQRGTSSESQL